MTFLNPLLLFGVLAVAAPIIIHMFMNRRIKPVVWAAMRFLQVSVTKNQKRMNLEDILLLLLRCLILILLALAMARPMFRGAAGAVAGKSAETAVIALDNSYSMGQSDGGATRFDEAKKAAEQVIDTLQPGSSVAVFAFSDTVRAAIPEPTFDLNLARKVLRDAVLSDRGTDVDLVLQQAVDTLGRHSAGVRRIYLITDGQAAGWKQMDGIVKMMRDPSVKSSVILVGGAEEHNLCVSDLRLASAMAAVGEASQFDLEVTNFGSSEAKNVAVRLSIDDESASDEGVIDSIPPHGAKRISLFTKFRAGGYHTVTGEVNADHLPTDDRRTIALRAVDDVRVLLVDGEAGGEARDRASFYLGNALTPVPAAQRESYFIKTKTIGPSELDGTKLDDYETIVLADVSGISSGAADALAAYLTRGGGLIIFPGPKTDAAFYNDTFGKKLNLLPATLGPLRGKADQTDKFFALQAKDYRNRIVSIWNDPAAGSLASARFFAALTLNPVKGHDAQAGEAEVVLNYADGGPAIVERTWGRGRVVLFSSSANTAWNDLALHPVYLPLVERTLGSILDQQDAALNIAVGQAFEFVCDQDWVNRDALIAGPGDGKGPGSLRRIGLVNGLPLLRFDDTDKAGPYQATIKAEPPVIVRLAAQFNPEESNLTPLAQGQLDALAPVATVVHWTPGADLAGVIQKGNGGSEIWTTLAILAVIVACAEVAFAGIFSAVK